MKITQAPEFQPITIVLETKAEAEALLYAIDYLNISAAPKRFQRAIIALSNWFTNQSQL